VYAPQGDTELLLEALAEAAVPRGARMLDVCTGSSLPSTVIELSAMRR